MFPWPGQWRETRRRSSHWTFGTWPEKKMSTDANIAQTEMKALRGEDGRGV